MADGWARIIERVPFPARQVTRHLRAAIPLSLRHGAAFRETRKFLAESEWWSRDRLDEYRRQRLRALISSVHRSSPFYREMLDDRGIRPRDIQDVDDLRRLPLLTKGTLRENGDRIVPTDIARSRLLQVTTGGTTGVPMSIYWLRGVTESREWAFVWRGWGWAGLRPGMRKVVLRGDVLRPRRGGRRPCWEYNPIDRRLVMSTFDMNRETLDAYVEQIEKFRPQVIQAYPSALRSLTSHLEKRGRELRGIRCIVTCSETLFPHQRDSARRVLGCDVFDHYGTTERSVLVMQCEKLAYHVIPEYGVLELIGPNGEPVEEEGAAGEVVVTGFVNPAMPLIRYRTGDIAIRGASECSCGRNHDLLERVVGRIQEFFVEADGTLTSAIWSDGPFWEVPDSVEAYQYVQDQPGELALNVEAEEGLSTASRDLIHLRFAERYPRITLRIFEVDRIPRTGRGKFLYVVQHLDTVGREFDRDV